MGAEESSEAEVWDPSLGLERSRFPPSSFSLSLLTEFDLDLVLNLRSLFFEVIATLLMIAVLSFCISSSFFSGSLRVHCCFTFSKRSSELGFNVLD